MAAAFGIHSSTQARSAATEVVELGSFEQWPLHDDGRFLIEMQTGDVIEIEADSFEFRRSHIGAAG